MRFDQLTRTRLHRSQLECKLKQCGQVFSGTKRLQSVAQMAGIAAELRSFEFKLQLVLIIVRPEDTLTCELKRLAAQSGQAVS